MFDVDEFVAECHAALAETQPSLAVKELVERAVSDPGAIDAALGQPRAGGLRCLHRSPELTVLQLVWPPRVALFPHDHRMWTANGIYGGVEDNVFFRRHGSTIERSGTKQLGPGDVGLLGEDAIHAVTNPRDSYTAAIHVYGGDYFGVPRRQWDATTLIERPFDVDAVRDLLDAADRRSRNDSREDLSRETGAE
jgi:predicted metal-dependent enzyme (double-stranded beta helix superfamily)